MRSAATTALGSLVVVVGGAGARVVVVTLGAAAGGAPAVSGVTVDRTYQLNFGGNSDFLNMLERDRLTSKKISKTQAVVSQLHDAFDGEQIHVGPSDYVPWLQDRKFAHIRVEGTGFGGTPISVELKLEVWDSPNSAGVVIDAIRCAKIALDRKLGGAIIGPSSYYMKSPAQQFSDDEARREMMKFVQG